MASKMHMAEPMCLIENIGGKFVVCQEALQLVYRINDPVVVVAVVGLFRTGKSYLMNKLAKKNKGFPLGANVQAKTKGLWMWCVPYPNRPNQTLVLLDTEGLGDTEKGDSKNDTWIFALAVLLSSTLVYNSLGTIDQTAMERLHYVAELTEHIKAKASTGARNPRELEDSAEYVRFFPHFIWAVRDFVLLLELDGHPITEDEYLENSLKLKKAVHEGRVNSWEMVTDNAPVAIPVPQGVDRNTREVQMFNFPRECIQLFFPTRKCFVFDRPTTRDNLRRLDEMQESELDQDFVKQANKFRNHVYQVSQPKTVPGGHVINGRLLANLVETFVSVISSGGVPCMENAVLALAQIENSAAVLEATAHYVALMEKKLKLPTESLQELLRVHAECEEPAIQMFMARAFKDKKCQFQAELMNNLEQKKVDYCHKNEQESSKCCLALLAQLSEMLEDKIKKGMYTQRGGYQQFLNDQKTLIEKYRQKSGKGLMAEIVLQKFLENKETTGRTILQSDDALTAKEKQMEETKARAEAAEREQEAQKQRVVEQQQKLDAQEKSYKANIELLKDKMEKERQELLKEQERMVENKLREHNNLMEQEFHKQAEQLNQEIRKLKDKNEDLKKPSFFSQLVDGLIDTVSVVLPGYTGLAAGLVAKTVKKILS